MPINRNAQPRQSGQGPVGLVLSLGLPLLLVFAFLGRQFVNFDSIGWHSGFSHPLTGWDHLVTMLAVGIWAAQLRGQAIWMLPLAFVGVMSLGGLAGAAGISLPSVEGIILLSCAVFSVLITRKVRFSAKVNVLIVAFFAFFHGYAHGQEISTSASLISYTLGFMLATLLLHGAGILVAKLVVFCVTCLLTAMFANAALAKSNNPLTEDSLNAPAKWVRHGGFQQANSSWLTLQRADEGDDGFALSRQRAAFADSAGCRNKVGSSQTDRPSSLFRLSISESHTVDKLHSYWPLAKTQPDQDLGVCRDRAIFDGDHLVNAGLDFKHYYRDVNHTPGKHLLSNGVGLTSPPVSSVLAPQAFRNSRTTPNILTEESYLQSKFAQPHSGKPHTQTIKYAKPDCAVRNQDFTWHAFRDSLVCPPNTRPNLTADTQSLSGIFSIHLLSVSQIRLPFAMSVTAQDEALNVSTITIKNQTNI